LISIPKGRRPFLHRRGAAAEKGGSVGEELGKEQREESYTISKRRAVSIVAYIKLIFSSYIVETLAVFIFKMNYV
jgi:hypothetical protein